MHGKASKRLEEYLFDRKKPVLSFKDLFPYTALGSAGGAVASSFHLLGYARTALTEGFVRFASGATDSLVEGGYAAVKELPKYFRRSGNRGGPAVYYVAGKLLGAGILSWMPHYILRNMGVDVHDSFPGAIVPMFYGQGDQIGAFVGMLIYHTRKSRGIRKGIRETLGDPVSQTSLLVSVGSVTVDGIVRIPWSPTNFFADFVETYLFSLLCLLPVWRGRIAERKMKT